MTKEQVRCAIYTRKSSEEGLEQSFNSLDAQREACEAFIASQKHEGWVALKTKYDDGGFSGGSMERPALNRLLEDVAAGNVSTVVVYKIDRLTRSLLDFSKIVESFDAKQVSFVSVTQQFNTTTSMGRLTLNILLSFAQFEREVTGERIRDKFAASKKKGMWMGGGVPLGYRVENRQLVVVPTEAELVREIYRRYLELGSVAALRLHLRLANRQGRNNKPLCRGALYHLLANRTYIGQVEHRGQVYAGQQAAIIDLETWNRVAEMLCGNSRATQTRQRTTETSLLTGLLFDAAGVRYTPTHAVKKGKRYRYYTSQSVIQHHEPAGISRLPASELDNVVVSRVQKLLSSPEELIRVLEAQKNKSLQSVIRSKTKTWSKLSASDWTQTVKLLLKRVTVRVDSIEIAVSRSALKAFARGEEQVSDAKGKKPIRLGCEIQVHNQGCETQIISDDSEPSRPSPSLIKGIVCGRKWYDRIVQGEIASFEELAKQERVTARYVRRVFRCASLSPEMVEAIVNGRRTTSLTRISAGIPELWTEQRFSA